MEPIERDFQFLTAGFPHGAYQSQNHNEPELRGPSARGQIRWWFDALFDSQSADEIFGTVRSGTKASKLVVRVKPLEIGTNQSVPFIPHKGNRGGSKNAYRTGSSFQLSVSDRRRGLSEPQTQKVTTAIDAWLLLGGIGQRVNRAGGSIWPLANAPKSSDDYADRCKRILGGSKLSFAILPGSFDGELEARRVAGDFLADDEFTSCMTPFGSARPRKPSNLKLKAVCLDNKLHLVALWDGRFQAVDNLKRGIQTLAKSKRIGQMLAQVQDQF